MQLKPFSVSSPSRGVSSIGLMVILAILALGASVAVPLLLDPPKFSRLQMTRDKMAAVKAAIVGNPDILPGRQRHSFGFVGDLGILPPDLGLLPPDNNLLALFEQGSYPSFTASPVNHIRFGWRGPYLDSAQIDGQYAAILDAWGTPMRYTSDAVTAAITSAGPDRDIDTVSDNLTLTITEDEWCTPVSGLFFDRTGTKAQNETQLTIHHPDGTAALATTVITPLIPTQYNSLTDTLTGSRRIPIGLRTFQARDIESLKLVALNGGPMMTARMFGGEVLEDALLFQNSFDKPSDLGPAGGTTPLRTIRGTWTISGGSITSSYGHMAFGQMGWRDYRLEADATLNTDARGYGIYYRSNGEDQVTGYIFQFDPGVYGPFGDGLELVIRRVYMGNENYFPPERRFLVRVRYNRTQFETLFGGRIWGDSHHVSITVSGERHIIKLNGIPVIDVLDTEPIFPCGGLCGMAGFRTWNGSATFHHVRVTAIPPFPDEEKVWWSFEEGNGNRFYGSGFLIDGPEQNGFHANATRLALGGVYGASIRLATTNPPQYLTVPDHNDLDLSSKGSLSLWIYPEESNQRSGGLIHKGNLENLSDLAYSLEFHANDRLRLYLVNSSGTAFNLESLKQFGNADRNRWHQIVAVWDHTGMALYINGSLDSQNTTPVVARNSPAPLILGAQFTFSAHNQWRNYPFRGRIDEVHLFNRRLTSAQVLLLYDKERGP
jgi:hypothetical protein